MEFQVNECSAFNKLIGVIQVMKGMHEWENVQKASRDLIEGVENLQDE